MYAVLLSTLLSLPFPILSIENHELLPPIYKIEDYDTCLNRNDVYCQTVAKLRNNGYENNIIWRIIKDSKNDSRNLDRSVIHRGICAPKIEAGSTESIGKFTELHINEELRKTYLIAHVEDVTCTTGIFKISSYDICLLIFVAMYIILISYATMYDRRRRNNKSAEPSKVLISFSLISNWEKICKIDGNKDFNKLKSIQGIRFYTMLLVILLHTKLSCSLVYVSNPEHIETMHRNAILKGLLLLDFFLVQIFLLISSWILTFQIYNIYREQKKFTVKQAFSLVINRYFRFNVCSTVMLLLLQSSFIHLFEGPVTFDNYIKQQRICRSHWWQTFFFVNNYSYFGDMCHPTSWYLSVDFQLYTMAIFTIYIILKFKMNWWKVLSFIFFLSYIFYGLFIYINGMDIIARLTANSVRKYLFFKSDDFKLLYTSTHSCWSTSIVGICLGILYSKNKNRNVINKKITSFLYLLMFALPYAALFISGKEFQGIGAAILGPLVKPLFSLGIGIGILAMSHDTGGFLKRACENKYVLLISNFSFSIYVFQTMVIFSKGIGSYSMLEYGEIQIAKYFLFVDVPGSIIIGVIGALLFEQPGINLQKLFLPQISHGDKHQKEKSM